MKRSTVTVLTAALLVVTTSGCTGSRPDDVPGGIQWSSVSCQYANASWDDSEICSDALGNFVSPSTAHSYGIYP